MLEKVCQRVDTSASTVAHPQPVTGIHTDKHILPLPVQAMLLYAVAPSSLPPLRLPTCYRLGSQADSGHSCDQEGKRAVAAWV
ncbi:hypothetical protein Pcinc_021916 [Petrolisthes cinctipes]|uniref:Uncharacterized protein n=1 Tax=Petrolisthes cinctipes TaxID=88211 RepID=A0AAE1FFT4_PETCI|nr:hypothetical protein Pcinc_021916 [Petrolisthes cinctipes]